MGFLLKLDDFVGFNMGKRSHVTASCLYCEEDFYPLLGSKGKYCSQACKIEAQKEIPQEVTPELIKRSFQYNPETGEFLRYYLGSWIKAGCHCRSSGYIRLTIQHRVYFGHVIAWILMKGEFPPLGMSVDHKNLDRADNRWINLRLATPAQNNANRPPRTGCKSGLKGVRQLKGGKWEVTLTKARKNVFWKLCDSKEDAIALYNQKATEIHGEFAYLNSIEESV